MAVSDRIEAFSLKDSPRKKQGLVVFLVSVVIAFVFWLLFALNESYTISLPLKVTYINYPDNKVLNKPLPEQLDARIEAEGWSIIKLKRSPEEFPVLISLSRFANSGFIHTSRLEKTIDFKELNYFRVLNISRDTIHLYFEDIGSKEVPVEIKLDVEFADQYGYAGNVIINPDKIKLTGPESEIEKVDTVYTKLIEIDELKEDYTAWIPVQLPASYNIKSNISKVQLDIPVDRFTEGKLNMHVQLSNPFMDSIKLIPPKVHIKYQTALSNFSMIDSNSFKAFVNTDNILPDENHKLKVQLKKNFPHLYHVSVYPEYVTYVIKETKE